MHAFAPKAQLTAIVDDWDPYYVSRVKAVMDGSWASGDTWDGLAKGMVVMAPYGDAVPEDVRAAADAVRDGIISGDMHAFDGPIVNQAGEQVIGEGETLDDGTLLGMDWYVQGVQGELGQ